MSGASAQGAGAPVPGRAVVPSASSPAVSTVPASIPSAGAPSLRALGIDHYYDPQHWESTHDAGDLEAAEDNVCYEGYGRGTYEFATLVNGPTLYAGHYPIGWVEDSDPGDIDDWELRFYPSHEAWKEAVASAIEARRAATGTGAVHESAVPTADAQISPNPKD
jgi:hypothetical protein